MKIIFRAYDGREFSSQPECQAHEELITERIMTYAQEIKDFCQSEISCDDCPFAISNGSCRLGGEGEYCDIIPANWEI